MTGVSAVLLAGRQAGCVGLLALKACGAQVRGVVAYGPEVEAVARGLGLPVAASIADPAVTGWLAQADVLVCVHGREIVPDAMLRAPRFGGINIHPCLSRYPGARPIARLLQDGSSQASVGAHRMTPEVDAGPVLREVAVDVAGAQTEADVYNRLYPWYAVVLWDALRAVREVDASPLPR